MVSFIHWMAIGVPIALVLLLLLWGMLLFFFPPGSDRMEMKFSAPLKVGPRLLIASGTFAVTVGLWMTEPLHAIPAAVAAMLPVAVFTATGVLDGGRSFFFADQRPPGSRETASSRNGTSNSLNPL